MGDNSRWTRAFSLDRNFDPSIDWEGLVEKRLDKRVDGHWIWKGPWCSGGSAKKQPRVLLRVSREDGRRVQIGRSVTKYLWEKAYQRPFQSFRMCSGCEQCDRCVRPDHMVFKSCEDREGNVEFDLEYRENSRKLYDTVWYKVGGRL